MKSPFQLCPCVPTQRLKAGILELEETAVAMQVVGRNVLTATDKSSRIELLNAMFSVRSVPYQTLNV
jgi:hypothetical protein